MKRILLSSIALFLFLSLNAQVKLTRLTADPASTKLEWKGEKVLGQHSGTVNLKSGWITLENNQVTSGEFIIDMPSIEDSEDNQKLEGHLKSDDFFGVQKFPESKLVLTGSTPFDKGIGTVTGNLTIKDVTNPLEFKASIQKKDNGTYFFSRITVDRAKYNIKYGSGSFFDNLGDKTIYDEFELKISLLMK
ncbi:MAG: YceI family protein [Methanosarcina sp.]